MKNFFKVLILIPFLFSCKQNDQKSEARKLIVKEVLDITTKYASEKFKEPKITNEIDGTITIAESQVDFITVDRRPLKYVIKPAFITTGRINEDPDDDAIITINSFKGDYEEMPEHLIIVTSDGKLMLSRVMEEDMSVLGIKDQTITAEVRSHSRNSPLRDCNACKEVVNFVFKSGELVKKE